MSARFEFTPSHLGLCVANLERSLRFYCDGLGFEKGEVYSIGNEYRAALEVDGEVALTSQFIRRAALAIELLAYASPGTSGRPASRRNQLGFTHLSFHVSELDAAARQLVACGATLLTATRTRPAGAGTLDIVFVADPDGVRIELMGP